MSSTLTFLPQTFSPITLSCFNFFARLLSNFLALSTFDVQILQLTVCGYIFFIQIVFLIFKLSAFFLQNINIYPPKQLQMCPLTENQCIRHLSYDLRYII